MFLQLPHQAGLSFQGFRYHQQTAGIFIKPVNDARAWHPAQLRCVVQQRIQHGALPVAATGVYDESGGLINDHEHIILINYIQRDGFGGMSCFNEMMRRFDLYLFSTPQFLFGNGLSAIHAYPFFQHPGLQAATRPIRQQACQRLIKPHSSAVMWDYQFNHDVSRFQAVQALGYNIFILIYQ